MPNVEVSASDSPSVRRSDVLVVIGADRFVRREVCALTRADVNDARLGRRRGVVAVHVDVVVAEQVLRWPTPA